MTDLTTVQVRRSAHSCASRAPALHSAGASAWPSRARVSSPGRTPHRSSRPFPPSPRSPSSLGGARGVRQVTALAHLQAYAAATSAERIAVFLGLAEPKELGGRQRSGASERDRSRAHAAAPPCCGQCVLDARCGLEQHARRLGAEQWGCYEELVDRTQPPVVVMACVDASGQPAACLPGAGVPVRTLHYSQHSLEHDLQRIHGCDSRGLRAESRSAATPTRSALRGGSIAAAGCAALVVVAAAGLATHARRRSGGVESEVELRSMRAA